MPRGGGGRGKRSHKGQRRQFTEPEDLKAQAEKEERERQWRKQRGIESDEEQEGEGAADGTKEETAPPAAVAKPASGSDSSESESSEEDEGGKAKGVEHLIEVENPNRAGGKRNKKVSELGDATTTLSRREREELEKQEARRRYQQLHMAGKTDEAQADLARLAIIRKQREDAARKKDEERRAKEEAKEVAAKTKGKS
ncbi:hypothetical protein C0Q70_00070 [Pomacea canaliculata]|uniref:Casein kinase substrate phosphoprotein PP28 domain-containing protein n=1 Tax=Pomacea canaliculata TaxID=400727 RepID=A0A2T7PVQ9_POMCA|nr:28 kDa heat- and acid-stable phosphoprotein-like [Pomacea canaliculata]PVD37480.1 hypothetical protein C0Q70_00070 [Pomacea canaliculata]